MKNRSTKRLTSEDIENRVKDRITKLGLDHIKFVEITEFKGSSSKIKLYCTVHNVTWVIDYHTIITRQMFGCRRCGAEHRAINTRLSRKNFIKRAKEIHGDKYDYSKVHEFKNMNEKVEIICKKHGPFFQTPAQHILGKAGCRKCFNEQDSIRKFNKGKEKFFREAAIKYNNKYDYSKVEYNGWKTKVCIICPEHGEFWQTPEAHLASITGCPECSIILSANKKSLGEDIYIDRINKKISYLKNRGFDISYVRLVKLDGQLTLNERSHVLLHCNIHNITWESSIGGFISGNGVFCPECSKQIQRSNGEKFCYNEVIKYRKIEQIISNKKLDISKNSRYSNTSMILLPDIYIKEVHSQDIIIEYDGKQHYEYEPYLQETSFNFIKQVRRDQFLEAYCKDNNIKLLRIPWKDENRIPEIIRSFLVDGIDITTKVYPKIPPVVIIKDKDYGQNFIDRFKEENVYPE